MKVRNESLFYAMLEVDLTSGQKCSAISCLLSSTQRGLSIQDLEQLRWSLESAIKARHALSCGDEQARLDSNARNKEVCERAQYAGNLDRMIEREETERHLAGRISK